MKEVIKITAKVEQERYVSGHDITDLTNETKTSKKKKKSSTFRCHTN